MRRKALSLAAGVCAVMLATAAPALADNSAANSVGAVQVGAIGTSPSAQTADGGTSASAAGPATIGSGGDNTASNSTGAVQVGGGNRSPGSTGAVQASGTHAQPSVTAGSAGRSANVGTSIGTAGGGNSANGSTGAVQVGGGNNASGSTGAVQSSSPTGGAAVSAGGTSASFGPGGSSGSSAESSAAARPLSAVATPGSLTGKLGSQQVPSSSTVRSAGTSRALAGRHTTRTGPAQDANGTLPFTGLAIGPWLALGGSLLLLGLGLRRGRAKRV